MIELLTERKKNELLTDLVSRYEQRIEMLLTELENCNKGNVNNKKINEILKNYK